MILLMLSGCNRGAGDLRSGFESGRFKVVVAFGDSIVAGYRQPEGWPQILARGLTGRYPGVKVVNAGVSGDTAADGARRVEKDVLDGKPDLVLIAFGLNDMKNGVPPERFRENLVDILSEVSTEGAQPVLLTTTRLQQGVSLLVHLDPAPYNDVIRTLARESSVPLIDVNARSKGLNTPQYLLDVVHPNQEGYRRLAEIIRKGLIGE